MSLRTIITKAPAKAILLGEHAVNRGQAALAVSVGLYSTCTLSYPDEIENRRDGHPQSSNEGYVFQTAEQSHIATRSSILELATTIDHLLLTSQYEAIQRIAQKDFFAAAKYVIAAQGETLPRTMHISLASEIPPCAGLGSGGSIFVALAAALASIQPQTQEWHAQAARWALRGDIIAHGGTASGLDTQTSLYGQVIRYTAHGQGESIPCADGLHLIIGNTQIFAATSQVNARVRSWLNEQPVRLHYFQEIGLLVKQAEIALEQGNWTELGHLLNLNQLLLERIGVSCPEIERLNEAALAAGALGAKLSGSGGGGIMIALVPSVSVESVAQAIHTAGGIAIIAPTRVAGATVQESLSRKDTAL